jgi:hypothetical protein
MLDYPTDDALERICDAHWNGGKGEGIRFLDIYQHNACNHTLSGTIDIDGVEYGFIIDNGNNNGTDVREWGLADDIGTYTPPEPGEPVTFVPVNLLSPALLKVYHLWRKESWFKEKESGLRYDQHFAPGGATNKYYSEWAAKKGMRIGYLSDVQKEGVDKADIDELVKAWEEVAGG